MNRASLLQVAGLAGIALAAFLLSVVLGVLVAGIACLLLGIAEELR